MTAALYPCRITHLRGGAIRRAFRYRSYLWLVDLDDLPRVPWWLRPLATFRSRDHLGDPGAGIRANVDAYLSRHGIGLAGGRVLMLAHARVLGHVFNPLTVYWCHRADGSLAAVLAEVHNTYRQRHVYLLPPDARGRAEADKDFYVSPFLPPTGRYRMRLPAPAAELRLSITLHTGGRTLLAATVTGTRRGYTAWRLLGCAVRYPWVTAQVSARIRWQGIRIAARQPAYPRPVHDPQEGVYDLSGRFLPATPGTSRARRPSEAARRSAGSGRAGRLGARPRRPGAAAPDGGPAADPGPLGRRHRVRRRGPG